MVSRVDLRPLAGWEQLTAHRWCSGQHHPAAAATAAAEHSQLLSVDLDRAPAKRCPVSASSRAACSPKRLTFALGVG
jgi:hypothetical protein